MKKQSGFTLIELMVVMAIIAILATAGLSAYTGYLKKARDATRIADISAINVIVTGMMSTEGKPPQTTLDVYNAVKAANNDIILADPLSTTNGTVTKSVCVDSTASATLRECSYTYRVCDTGYGFAVGARFESSSNYKLYADDAIAGNAGTHADGTIYELGSCQAPCTSASTPAGCPAAHFNPTKIDSTATTVIGASA